MSYRPVQHHPRACLHCGKSYTPRRSDGMYCSSSCCSQANYLVNPRTKKGDSKPEEPKPKEAKEPSFTKQAVASAVGQVAVEVIENVIGVGNAARLSRIEKQNQRLERQNQQILWKLDAQTPEPLYEVNSIYSVPALSDSIPTMILKIGQPALTSQEAGRPQRTSNSFSKYGPQFDAKDIIM